MLLFPLLMGMAIDDFMVGGFGGLVALAGLGLSMLVFGAGRRFYDTRIYSEIYATISPEMVETEKPNGTAVSEISARSNMRRELVEFLEHSFPSIIESGLGLVGALVIIALLQFQVFLICLTATIAIVILYSLTSKKTYRLNQGLNNELETQVSVLEQEKSEPVRTHFRRLKRWNIHLSDLETWNF